MSDLREFVEGIVYDSGNRRRFTQESPVMPDVWIQFALHPGEQQDLLLVPHRDHTPAELAREIHAQLDADRSRKSLKAFRADGGGPAHIAYNQNAVVATLWFDQLARAVMPLSRWWATAVCGMQARGDADRLARLLKKRRRDAVAELVAAMDPAASIGDQFAATAWLARVGGLIAYMTTPQGRARLNLTQDDGLTVVERLEDILEEEQPALATTLIQLLKGTETVDWDSPCPLFSVNLNRRTSASVIDSVPCIKADAARRVFEVRGKQVRWAVVDSGVDAEHVAFRKRDADGKPLSEPFPKHTARARRGRARVTKSRNETRIVATYDFVHVRELLGARPDDVDDLDRTHFPVLEDAGRRSELRAHLERVNLQDVDWAAFEPFLRVPHEAGAYRRPLHHHGTHVAGIIAADWRADDTWSDTDLAEDAEEPPLPRKGDLVGIGPEIELYDLRVLGDTGDGDEFSIMSALQFVRDLNARRDSVAVHGANLSFSIPHDVANYACGRTPVCEEATRLVGSGTLVVAAAGNNGRARYLTPDGLSDDGFRTVSITDPGNAEAVITVGATHRRDAHTYGVSYFSSRGPTGDGRLKPDLVAPGEKILSTVPHDGDDRLDGTSMAAPHVSGAAALLLARHPELIGEPARIKEILCATASDLRRERYFQGAGLLDILRALQSV